MEQSKIQIDRPVYTQSSLDVTFKLRQTELPSTAERIKQSAKSKCRCSPFQCVQAILGLFPFLGHIKGYRYKWRTFLPGDITAGLTVGIMHIPMGMGFAVLANVPPIYGLYTSFWCVLLYFIFGQSPHMSFGSMAIMSIMLSEATSSHDTQLVANSNHLMNQSQDLHMAAPISSGNLTSKFYMMNSTIGTRSKDILTLPQSQKSIIVARTMLVTMLSGIILIAMSVLKLSKVVAFIPISCISAFTTAVAFHIVTSQFKFLLGITIPSHKGIFKFVKLWREIILELPNTNLCDLVISLCCLNFLFVIKVIVNPKYRHKLPVPIPAEMFVVIAVTLVSHFGALNDRYGIVILNETPAGFASPMVPDFTGIQDYLLDAFLIAIISFIISYSMVSTFARKHKYEVSTSHEMMAYGLCHLIGSFFGSFVAAGAPPRCTVLDTTGAKTQLVHVFTSLVLLLTILVIGPLFEPLPNSCLSAIIICALIPLFKQFQHLVQFWKINKYDFAIWIVTWASVVFLDIAIGLAVGVGFSVTTVVVQACYSQGTVLSTTGHPDLHQPAGKHELSEDTPGIKIFRFESSLHFASRAQFKDQLFKLTANPQKLPLIDIRNITAKSMQISKEQPPKIKPTSNSVKNGISDVYTITNENAENGPITETLRAELYAIVVDFSSISYIDVMGVNLIKQLKSDYRQVGINLVLANCSGAILRKLEAAGIGSKGNCENGREVDHCDVDIFPTIHDAVTVLSHNHKYQPTCNGHAANDEKTSESNGNIPISKGETIQPNSIDRSETDL